MEEHIQSCEVGESMAVCDNKTSVAKAQQPTGEEDEVATELKNGKPLKV